jgi:antitoxin ParD1/3/4
MPSIEKISIALPQEMVAAVRQAVEDGEYASSSEVVRDALRDWTHKRRVREQGLDDLRRAWQEAMENPGPPVDADEVMDRLKRKYRTVAGRVPKRSSRK